MSPSKTNDDRSSNFGVAEIEPLATHCNKVIPFNILFVCCAAVVLTIFRNLLPTHSSMGTLVAIMSTIAGAVIGIHTAMVMAYVRLVDPFGHDKLWGGTLFVYRCNDGAAWASRSLPEIEDREGFEVIAVMTLPGPLSADYSRIAISEQPIGHRWSYIQMSSHYRRSNQLYLYDHYGLSMAVASIAHALEIVATQEHIVPANSQALHLV